MLGFRIKVDERLTGQAIFDKDDQSESSLVKPGTLVSSQIISSPAAAENSQTGNNKDERSEGSSTAGQDSELRDGVIPADNTISSRHQKEFSQAVTADGQLNQTASVSDIDEILKITMELGACGELPCPKQPRKGFGLLYFAIGAAEQDAAIPQAISREVIHPGVVKVEENARGKTPRGKTIWATIYGT